MTQSWYVVRTEPRGEYLAAKELGRDGFEVLFPRAKTPHPRTGFHDVPLFPGYLFLKCAAQSEGMPSLSQAAHVWGWVSFDGVVPPVPDGFVEQLIQRLEAIDQDGGLWKRFQCGEKVRVVYGGIQNVAEVVEEAKSPQARVRVLMEFMGRVVSTQVPWENLQSIQGDAAKNDPAPRRTRGRGRWIRGFGTRAAVGA